jgi:TorA maturation chaperone TorD
MSGTRQAVPGRLALFGVLTGDDLRLLSALHASEPCKEGLQGLVESGFPSNLGLILNSAPAGQATELLHQALRDMAGEGLSHELLDILAVDYADIYLTHAFSASPQESVWFDEEGCICQQSMFQVREWYRRHGCEAENWRILADDHLILQLAFLGELQRTGMFSEAARFLDEHLLRWIGQFSERVAGRCATRYFAGLNLLTAAYLEELRSHLEKILDEPRPGAEEIQRRMELAGLRAEPIAFMPGAAPGW